MQYIKQFPSLYFPVVIIVDFPEILTKKTNKRLITFVEIYYTGLDNNQGFQPK